MRIVQEVMGAACGPAAPSQTGDESDGEMFHAAKYEAKIWLSVERHIGPSLFGVQAS